MTWTYGTTRGPSPAVPRETVARTQGQGNQARLRALTSAPVAATGPLILRRYDDDGKAKKAASNDVKFLPKAMGTKTWGNPDSKVQGPDPGAGKTGVPFTAAPSYRPSVGPSLGLSMTTLEQLQAGQPLKQTLSLREPISHAIDAASLAADVNSTIVEQIAANYSMGSNGRFYLKDIPGRRGYRGGKTVKIDKLGGFVEGAERLGKLVTGLVVLKDIYDVTQAEAGQAFWRGVLTTVVDCALAASKAHPAISLTIGFASMVMSTDEYARTRIADIDFKIRQIREKWKDDPTKMHLDPQWDELHAQRQELWDRLHPEQANRPYEPKQLYFKQGPLD